MLDDIKDKVPEIEAGQNGAEPEKPETPKVIIGIHQPPEVNGWIWDCYCLGINEFWKLVPQGTERYAKYAGAIACVKAGFFVVTAPPDLMKYIDAEAPYSFLPAGWIGLIEQYVVTYIELAYRRPSTTWEIVMI